MAHTGTVTAILGPTNTGKTHMAIERMLAHKSGMIGLPLRLLAREVYETCVAKVGHDVVSMVTGEERIIPANPRYWVCTTEAMPKEQSVDFVAIDEIQLATDMERGHVFTDRILNWRGQFETMLLGAPGMSRLLDHLLPDVNILTRPRLSRLTFSGMKKFTSLPPRSAIVAFSIDDVYQIAELLKRHRGGAATVMGGFSPRTRNAQVALYQNGDVDYLVATDAIGMGLNLDIDHVGFASLRKFDGTQFRALAASEIAQIAGRAGRYNNNGTFGLVPGLNASQPKIDSTTIDAIENYDFPMIKAIQWRNQKFDYSSVINFLASIDKMPQRDGLIRSALTTDRQVFDLLTGMDSIKNKLTNSASLQLLWQVCQIPDYCKISIQHHAGLVSEIYTFLSDLGRIPDDWLERQIRLNDNITGNIDHIVSRLARIRIWTFITNHHQWISNSLNWQGLARTIEDKLSDSLHEKLTRKFIDSHKTILSRSISENQPLDITVDDRQKVIVADKEIGVIDGFTFKRHDAANIEPFIRKIKKALQSEFRRKARQIIEDDDKNFAFNDQDRILWRDVVIARVVKANNASPIAVNSDDCQNASFATIFRPRVVIGHNEVNDDSVIKQVEERLTRFLTNYIASNLESLFALGVDESLPAVARGIAFRLHENFGIVDRHQVRQELKSLDQPTRALLRRHGVRFGQYHVYVPGLMRPHSRALLVNLWLIANPDIDGTQLSLMVKMFNNGRTTIRVEKLAKANELSPERLELYAKITGYHHVNGYLLRVDIIQRLADMIRLLMTTKTSHSDKSDHQVGKENSARDGEAGATTNDKSKRDTKTGVKQGFVITDAMQSLLGMGRDEVGDILSGLGYYATQPDLTSSLKDSNGDEAASVDKSVSSDQPETGVKPLVIWRPISARRSWSNKSYSENNKRGDFGNKNKTYNKNKSHNKTASHSNHKNKNWQDKVIDKDSPFYALMELKNKMDKTKNHGPAPKS